MRIKYYRLNRNGAPVPCTLEKWVATFGLLNRIVARVKTEHYEVSTVFLGLDHSFTSEGPPILWETMVFGDGPLGGKMTRCSGNKEQAEAMHEGMVERVLRAETKKKEKGRK